MKQFETTLQAINKSFKDPSALGVFVDNHDNARFLNNNFNIPKFKNAIAFGLLTCKKIRKYLLIDFKNINLKKIAFSFIKEINLFIL